MKAILLRALDVMGLKVRPNTGSPAINEGTEISSKMTVTTYEICKM